MLFNVFANKVKDGALQHLAKWFGKHSHLKHLGRITGLRIDRIAEEIQMELDLHGEQTLIELTVHYRIISPTLLKIADVKSSRQWIDALINDVIPEEQKRLEVPPAVTRVLSKLAQ